MVAEMQMMKEMMDFMMNALKGWVSNNLDELVHWMDSPFATLVTLFPFPTKFCMLQIEAYDRSKEPLDYLESFKNLMHLQGVVDEIMCQAFPTMLKGPVRVWFSRLMPNSIATFKELSAQFASYFIGAHRYKEVTYEWQNPWYPQTEYVEEVWKSSKMSLKWNGLSKGTLPKKMTAWFSCIITEHIRERARDMSIKELGAKRKTSNASSPNETFDLRGD